MVYGDWLFFEIVLCRNAYKGSNPFLCAKQKMIVFHEKYINFVFNFLFSVVSLLNSSGNRDFFLLLRGTRGVRYFKKSSMIARISAYSLRKISSLSSSFRLPFRKVSRSSCSGCV